MKKVIDKKRGKENYHRSKLTKMSTIEWEKKKGAIMGDTEGGKTK